MRILLGALAVLGIHGLRVSETLTFTKPEIVRKELKFHGLSSPLKFGLPRRCSTKQFSSVTTYLGTLTIRPTSSDESVICVDWFETPNSTVTTYLGHSLRPHPKTIFWEEIQDLRVVYQGCRSIILDRPADSYQVEIKSPVPPEAHGAILENGFLKSASTDIIQIDPLRFNEKLGVMRLKPDEEEAIVSSCYAIEFLHVGSLGRVESVKRTVWLPVWSRKTRMDEEYVIHNDQAHVQGPTGYRAIMTNKLMNRIIGTRRKPQEPLAPSPFIGALTSTIPRDATYFEFYDAIGNISTSSTRRFKNTISIEIEPRYPIYGQWKNSFVLKYLVPAPPDPTRFALPWAPSISGMWADKVTINLVLPSNSKAKKIAYPKMDPLSFKELSPIRSWFDIWTRRSVLEFEFQNLPLISTSANILEIELTPITLKTKFLHMLWFPTVFALVVGPPLIFQSRLSKL